MAPLGRGFLPLEQGTSCSQDVGQPVKETKQRCTAQSCWLIKDPDAIFKTESKWERVAGNRRYLGIHWGQEWALETWDLGQTPVWKRRDSGPEK